MKDEGGSQAVGVIMLIVLLAAAAYIAGRAYHSNDRSKLFRASARTRHIEKTARLLKLIE